MKCHLPEEEQTKMSVNSQMNLYDINKQVISQLPALNTEDVDNSKKIIVEYFNNTLGEYYMLLCNDLKYYTIFSLKETLTEPIFEDEVIDCVLDFVDNIKSINYDENKTAIEIWFTKDEETYVMYLFDYSLGVIECAR